MKTATLVKTFPPNASGAVWQQYTLSQPLGGSMHVIVSANVVPYSGPETYIFGCDADGEVTDWIELPGSYRGGCDHSIALESVGYGVIV